MLAGLGLFWVGAVLFCNGLWVLGKIGDNEIGVIDVFVGSLTLLIDVTASLGPYYTLLAFVIVIVGGLGSMAGALLGGVLIGVSEALAGLFIAPSAKSMFSFGLLILVLLGRL